MADSLGQAATPFLNEIGKARRYTMAETTFRLGCVADDFTGASDAASFLRKQGMKTILYNEIPQEAELIESCDAVVIALKSRTAPVEEAVGDSLQALRWLKNAGAEKLYVKYCSTFDSTKEGNIGPVLDAALEEFHIPYTILCPSLPVNGRTVKDGCLYVDGIPLDKTHMRNHPLTPMWDSDIAVLMREQSKYPCLKLSAEKLEEGREAVAEFLEAFGKDKGHFYVIPDYYEDIHGKYINACFGELPLLSGGSGLLGTMCMTDKKQESDLQDMDAGGKTLLLAGSCSKATLEQIRQYRLAGHDLIQINPEELLAGRQTAELLWEQIKGRDKVLLYSSDCAENVRKVQEEGKERVAKLLEKTMSMLAQRAVKENYTQIIVAGGETSGAVTKGLGYQSYLIGESIAPGVPIMIPIAEKGLRLVLKSGNFGQPDFFERAIEMTTGKRKDE